MGSFGIGVWNHLTHENETQHTGQWAFHVALCQNAARWSNFSENVCGSSMHHAHSQQITAHILRRTADDSNGRRVVTRLYSDGV